MEPDHAIYSGLPVVSMKRITGEFEAAARRPGDRHATGFGRVSIEGSGSPSILASNERSR
jgi:hypothetical protein